MYQELILPRDNYQAGLAIGQRSRRVMHEYILTSATWQSLQRWNGSRRLNSMEEAARSTFPDYLEELAGIAAGCELPFSVVFLWNCRGDLLPLSTEGCTSVCVPLRDGILLGHNEDGDPKLRADCFISKRKAQTDRPGFVSFTYPASINGHAFAVNSAGIVQFVDNIRNLEPGSGVPRQLLARAVLDCRSLDEVIATLEGCPRAGSFHHLLAQPVAKTALSIEYSSAAVSIENVRAAYGHSNHFIHPRFRNSQQRITASSAARQARIDELCRKLPDSPGSEDIHRMLRDVANPDLPIYRLDPNDPDNENNLATALFRVTPDSVDTRVYAGETEVQAFAGFSNSIPHNLKGGQP
jgi:hypothetical protein